MRRNCCRRRDGREETPERRQDADPVPESPNGSLGTRTKAPAVYAAPPPSPPKPEQVKTMAGGTSRGLDATGKVDLWDEDLQPWREADAPYEDLKTSRMMGMDVGFQWTICIVIVVITAGWLGHEGLQPQGYDRYVVPCVLQVLALLGFIGFVSPMESLDTPHVDPEECADNSEYVFQRLSGNLVLMYVSGAICAYCKCLLPFLIGTGAPVCFSILVPVAWAHSKGLVLYSYKWYSTASPLIGLFNVFSFLMVRYGHLPAQARWFLPGVIMPCMLSFFADLLPLTAGNKSVEYKLNLAQSTRLCLFRIGFFMFMIYGVCRCGEELIGEELGLTEGDALQRISVSGGVACGHPLAGPSQGPSQGPADPFFYDM